jgi:hypothetical protein
MNLLRLGHIVAVAFLLCCSLPGFAAEFIAGQVVHALNGNALKRVTLTAARVDGKGEPATTQVDENGQFVFRNLAPGGYLLSGERNGFDRQFHGARSNPNTGAVLRVLEGQPITGLVFRLFPNAALSGRVLDSDGEPLPNVGVSVFQRECRNGKRDWYPVDGADTNDRGEYRVSGLPAGRYLVSAADLNFDLTALATSKGPLPEAPDRINAITYYPGTTDLERAEPVKLARGEDRRGVDMQLLKSTAVRIRGRIAGESRTATTVVSLLPRTATRTLTIGGSGFLVRPGERAFEIRGARPGTYLLVAQSMGGASTVSAPLSIEVGAHHIDGVELTLTEGGEVAGRVLFDGAVAGTSVEIETTDFSRLPPAIGTANEAGDFKLKGVYSIPYRVRVANLPKGTYWKAARLAGQVVDPDSVSFLPGTKLEILLGKASAELKGVVLGTDEKPLAGAAVVLIPESSRDALYREATSDYDGTFLIKGIAPGRYKALAWEDLEPDAYRDPEVVKPVEDRAAPIALAENGRGEVRLKVVPIAKE